MTVFVGQANCAPIAAGNPKPMVPMPRRRRATVAGAVVEEELRGPHLVLADVGGDDGRRRPVRL